MTTYIEAIETKTQKMFLANKYFLNGKAFYTAMAALEFGREYHQGKRKDGAPEFSHQLSIGLYFRSLHKMLMYPEQTFAVVYLHDVTEDYEVSHQEVEAKFGAMIAEDVRRLNKNRNGTKMNPADYFYDLAYSPIGSVVKGGDRMHNFHTMGNAFSREKQLEYMEEGITYILPMLKKAYKNFPEQNEVYDNIRHILKLQIELISAGLGQRIIV